MVAVRIGLGTEVSVGETIYAVRRCLAGDILQLESEDDGQLVKIPRPELAFSVANGEASIIVGDRKHRVSERQDLSALPEKDRNELRRRLAYVKLVEKPRVPESGAALVKASIEIGAAQLNDLKPPSVATLYNWCKLYRQAGGDPAALVPHTKRRGNRQRRFAPEVLEVLQAVINERFLVTSRPRPTDIYSAVVVEIDRLNAYRPAFDQLPVPTLRTLYREIEKLEPYTFLRGRYGKYIAEKETRHVGKGAVSSRPLERVEIDHSRLDIIAYDEELDIPLGRPNLTMVIDHFSRMPLGFYLGFEDPSSASVMMALRSAIGTKEWVNERFPEIEGTWPCYGVPEVLVTDNGPEFHSKDLEIACAQLGITIQHNKVKSPWDKGVVERIFGEINWSVLSGAPGKTFHNSDARSENDPVGEASVPLKTLEHALCKWIVEFHAKHTHGGIFATLKHKSSAMLPLDKWNEGVEIFPPRLISDQEDLNVLLSCFKEVRKIHPKGIVIEGIWYSSRKLTELRNSSAKSLKVDMKFDPTNMGRIHVRDPRTNTYFDVPALDPEYAEGLGLWPHKTLRKYLRRMGARQIDPTELAKVKEHIHHLIQETAKTKKRKRTTNARIARFRESSSQAPTNEDRIVEQNTSYEISFDAAPMAEEEDYRDDLVEDDDFLADGMQRIQAVGKDEV
jgi:putative transposase